MHSRRSPSRRSPPSCRRRSRSRRSPHPRRGRRTWPRARCWSRGRCRCPDRRVRRCRRPIRWWSAGGAPVRCPAGGAAGAVRTTAVGSAAAVRTARAGGSRIRATGDGAAVVGAARVRTPGDGAATRVRTAPVRTARGLTGPDRVAAGARHLARRARERADRRLEAVRDLAADPAQHQRADERHDDQDQAQVLQSRLPPVPPPGDHVGERELGLVLPGPRRQPEPLAALRPAEEHQDQYGQEQLGEAVHRPVRNVGEAAEDQPHLYGDQAAPYAPAAGPGASREHPAHDSGRGPVQREADDHAAHRVRGERGAEQPEAAQHGGAEQDMQQDAGRSECPWQLPSPLTRRRSVTSVCGYATDRGHALSPPTRPADKQSDARSG